jgi:glycosyltransferase involved in cell wall biosynthesis
MLRSFKGWARSFRGLLLRAKSARTDALYLADRARDKGRWQEAARRYGEALEHSPTAAAIWVQYGHALKESGRIAEAETAYNRSLSLDGEIADTHLHLGHALKLQGKNDAAILAYLEAFRLDSSLLDAYLELLALGWGRRDLDSRAPIAGRRVEARKSATAPATGMAVPSGARPVVFDVSDMTQFFLNHRLPQGIQRIQINLISPLLRTRSRQFDPIIASFSANRGCWVRVPGTLFLDLAELAVAHGDGEDPTWRSVVNEVDFQLANGAPLQFPAGAVLINVGNSWYLPNYFLLLRSLKANFDVRYVPLIHDCIPIVTPEHCSTGHTQEFVGWLVDVFFHADQILVNSEATATDVVKAAAVAGHAMTRPQAVRFDGPLMGAGPSGISEACVRTADAVSRRGVPPGDFVLFVSTVEARKNHLLAFSTWLRLIEKRGPQNTPLLVCVGKHGWLVDPAMALLNSNSLLRQKVVILSDVADDELANLYRGCLFTLYPSLYEGWGLPVTEALSYGKIPLVSAVSSLPEAGGQLAEYFDPHSAGEFLEKTERLIVDPTYRAQREARIRSSFRSRDWSAIAAEMLHAVWAANPLADPPATRPRSAGEDEIWPLPAEFGRYYPIAKNLETDVWPGIVAGEMYRMGRGWWAPEDWGTWLRARQADLALLLPTASAAPCILQLGLRGNPSRSASFEVEVIGSGVRERSILSRDESRWVALNFLPAMPTGVVHVRVTADAECDLAKALGGSDIRIVNIGVLGFYICREHDLAARRRFDEALKLDRLDGLRGRLEAVEPDQVVSAERLRGGRRSELVSRFHT